MTANELATNVSAYCKANANEANMAKFSRFFKDGLYNGYGLTSPQMQQKVKELLKTPGVSLNMAVEAAPLLFKNDKYEEIAIGLLLVNGFGKQYTRELFNEIGSWYSVTINNWAHADTLGMFILPQFLKYKIIHYSDFAPWLSSPHKFQRRSVPVTLIKLLKSKTIEDFRPIFTFIEPLVNDPEREVHQGVGWFLREAWKLKPTVTEEFLIKWKPTAPRLIIQYTTEKMTPGEKLKYKR